MNIAFFLTPKSEVVYLSKKMTLRQAMEKWNIIGIKRFRYWTKKEDITGSDGRRYSLGKKRNPQLTFQDTGKLSLENIPRYWQYQPVSINATMDSLVTVAGMQSFVPVVDDSGTFIGIIKRGDILNYCYKQMKISEEACS